MQAVGEIEQVYFKNTTRHTMASTVFTVLYCTSIPVYVSEKLLSDRHHHLFAWHSSGKLA